MSYVIIENFRGGLDTRRFLLTAPAGTLQRLENAHVTRGGEIEKRKAFVSFADLPAGTFDLLATSEGLTVFGSGAAPVMPAGITYQQLVHPDGATMIGVRHSNVFNGRAFVIAEFANGEVLPYYDGELIADFRDGLVTEGMTNNDIAEMLKDLVDAHDDFSAVRTTNQIDITGETGEKFEVVGRAVNEEGEESALDLTVSTTQVAVDIVEEVRATTSFTITGGTESAGVNKITSVKADGATELLAGNVDWDDSNSVTAADVAASINSGTVTHGYTAESSGANVTVSAPEGEGEEANDRTLTVIKAGDVTVSTPQAFKGGVTTEAGQPQITRVTVGGTSALADRVTVIITREDGSELSFGAGRVAGVELDFALTLKSKLYAISGSTVYFSAVNDATAWNDTDTGSGFVNMANNFGSSEDLVALGVYQGNLAVFSQRTTQIWFVDPDPALNNQMQVLPNIGTEAKLSVVSYGESDSFFLADSGIRSLRARDSSNSAAVNDIGTPIDELVLELLATLPGHLKTAACAVIEPRDSRYWLALPDGGSGSTIFVFSYFPSSRIVAWSTYAVDFQVDRFAEVAGRVYGRADNKIVLYGGLTNQVYRAPDDEFVVEVELPFLDASKPATDKSASAMDMAAEGEWEVELGMDPLAPAARDLVGTFDESTFSLGRIDVSGRGTHFSFHLSCDTADYARLANLIFHYHESKAG